jgi:uncharacterized protein
LKLLDTNIVIYAVGRPHQNREVCQRLFQDIAAGSTDYAIDVELLQEVLYVYSSRGERGRALEIVDLLLQIFPDPLPISGIDVVLARNVMEQHPRLSPRDAIHLGVALNYRLEGIVTTDQDILELGMVIGFHPRGLYPV